MRILIVTDAWHPQVNGVVRTYENTARELTAMGMDLHFITPSEFRTIPCPTYPSIRLAMFPGRHLISRIEALAPDMIHIATEGPLGQAARKWCLQHDMDFTTSFHTRLPEYIRLRIPVPTDWSYAWLRRFHGKATHTMVPTASQARLLEERGFLNVVLWGRGVDLSIFMPGGSVFSHLPGPVFLYMGRVAVEKNIEVFLDMDLPGSKVVIGDGPDLLNLQRRYTGVVFTGFRFGRELAEMMASCDVFVFPSLTDTYGVVLLEAMACGLPIAAYPVTGPVDVVEQGVTGILDADLRKAALLALELDRNAGPIQAARHTWSACTQQFLENLVPARTAT